jgi:DNA-binding NtrC family response regulator
MDPLFIIIDDNRDGRFVLSRALFRHYPNAAIHEYRDFTGAREALAGLPADGGQTMVLLHRAPDSEGPELIRSVREVHPRVTIVALGNPATAAQAIAAGATRFLDYEAWLGLGTLVKSLEPGRANLPA